MTETEIGIVHLPRETARWFGGAAHARRVRASIECMDSFPSRKPRLNMREMLSWTITRIVVYPIEIY
jgi:hypothetical protein